MALFAKMRLFLSTRGNEVFGNCPCSALPRGNVQLVPQFCYRAIWEIPSGVQSDPSCQRGNTIGPVVSCRPPI